MKIREINFEDLMQECNIQDPAEFRRLLKANHLPVVSPRDCIDRKDANEIVRRLQGRNIDWYKYKQQERDHASGGPLQRERSKAIKERVEQLYCGMISSREFELPRYDCLIGLSCEGGFLEGPHGSSFSVSLDPSGNIFIGDRGSGKSTILNLLSLLADSVSEETDALVATLMTLFRPRQERIAELSRRVRQVLDQYGVRKLACFFTKDQKVRCYYVDLDKSVFDLVELRGQKWRSIKKIGSDIGPPMLILHQGEVTRIASRENQFYLSNILDALYPDLYEKRTQLAQDTKQLAIQFEHYSKRYTSFDSQPAYRFIERRSLELRRLWNDLENGDAISVRNTVIRDIGSYVGRYRMMDRSELAESIYDLLKGGEDAWFYLYIEGIIGLLARMVDFMEKKTDQNLGPEEKTDILNTGKGLADFLEERQKLFRSWLSIYSRKRLMPVKALLSLVDNYMQILQKRIKLIEYQEDKCRAINRTLNKGVLEVKVYTREAKEVIASHYRDIDELSRVDSAHANLMQATPQIRLEALYDLVDAYDNVLERLFERLDTLHYEAVESQPSFPFTPIEIQLLQGNVYRGFHQLSFGQKSGIILKMVLETTRKHIILIDQPEDNLDASSIVNMLAPTISSLQKDHQVIVATHDSNLVMGLRTTNLVLLESLGERGKLKLQGSLLRQNVVRGMLDVLEGGVASFDLKMKVYDDFMSHVRGLIEDADIMMVESSFRRRTIDGLRNYLQPVVSDRALLRFLRHELKQPDTARIRRNVLFTKQKLEESISAPEPDIGKILGHLNKLCDRLDNHIVKLQSAIEEIRLMDTEANPHMVNLYDLLREVKHEYISGIGKVRDISIEIDKGLQDQSVYADGNHLKLVFKNLVSNSLRATERKVINAWQSGAKNLSEVVKIELSEVSNGRVALLFTDNGCGIPPKIQDKLYIERCTDQRGRDHGLGGIIIRKLLDLNGGSIQVLESSRSGARTGTVQRIVLNHKKGEGTT